MTRPEMYMLPLSEALPDGAEHSLLEMQIRLIFNDERDTVTVMIGGFDRNGSEFVVSVRARQGVHLDLGAVKSVGQRLDDIVRFAFERQEQAQ